jgi:hypothetical protein
MVFNGTSAQQPLAPGCGQFENVVDKIVQRVQLQNAVRKYTDNTDEI